MAALVCAHALNLETIMSRTFKSVPLPLGMGRAELQELRNCLKDEFSYICLAWGDIMLYRYPDWHRSDHKREMSRFLKALGICTSGNGFSSAEEMLEELPDRGEDVVLESAAPDWVQKLGKTRKERRVGLLNLIEFECFSAVADGMAQEV